MRAAKDGQIEGSERPSISAQTHKRSYTLWGAALWLFLAIGYVEVLNFTKEKSLQDDVQELSQLTQTLLSSTQNLFQGHFYFSFEEMFVPGVRQQLSENKRLKAIQILNPKQELLFYSSQVADKTLTSGAESKKEKISDDLLSAVLSARGQNESRVVTLKDSISFVIPTEQVTYVYEYDLTPIRSRLAKYLLVGLVVGLVSVLLAKRVRTHAFLEPISRWTKKTLNLHFEFIVAILGINVLTSTIVFFSLTNFQTKEESTRVRKQATLFARFTTDRIINEFNQNFYFYYREKFIPSIASIIAANENLVSIKVISEKTLEVLFDSDEMHLSASTGTRALHEIPSHVLSDINTTGTASHVKTINDRVGFVVYQSPMGDETRNANRTIVEYAFVYQSLVKSIALIRAQIFRDLIPSFLIGLIVALGFGQFLIRPIRKLSRALKKVTEGEYDISLQYNRTDEIGDLLESFNQMAEELRKKKELQKYLSDSNYKQIIATLETEGAARLRGTRVEATVLFSDIRDFVKHCENMDAEEVTTLLNEYFTEMVEVVYRFRGEVDKFIGDALLAVFYKDPKEPSQSDTALRALFCSLHMMDKLAEFNRKRTELQKPVLEIGVGISHGEVISGPIGSKDRRDFTVIGDVVNLASRIEKLSRNGKHTRIVFSDHVQSLVKDLVSYEELKHTGIKGKDEKVSVYELVSVKNLTELFKKIKSPDIEERVKSIELLGHSRNFGAIAELLSLLQDSDERVRIAVIEALVKLASLDDQIVLETLFRKVKIEKSVKVLSALISALGRITRSERLFELEEFLEYKDDRIVANAIEAISHLKNPRATDLLLPKLGSRSNRIKANAAIALFSAGHMGVIDNLKPMCLHSDPAMRSSAAFALGELAQSAHSNDLARRLKAGEAGIGHFLAELQGCVPMLVALLADESHMVRKQAIIALGKIKDQSAVYPLLDCVKVSGEGKNHLPEISAALRSIGSHRLIRDVLDKME